MLQAQAKPGEAGEVAALDPLERAIVRPGEASRRSIPEAVFIENVEALCTGRKPTDVVAKLQELHSKYQYMQSSLVAQRSGLKVKLPDISAALETVNHLVNKRTEASDAEYVYQLSENIYSRATVEPTDKVCLWLGANCMLEYTLDEAVELLRTNEANARTTLANLDEDMAFLRDQITTTEVNIARTHNYGVKLRQKGREDTGEPLAPVVQASAPAATTAAAAKPSGGGSGGGFKYTFAQTGEEVEVSVPVPKGSQKSEVKVTILADSLRVEHNGTVLLEGRLAGRCSPNGSTWTMPGARVEISLEKAEPNAWPSLFEEEAT